MQSISSLLHDRDPNDPLVRTLAALLDSGLIVATRDGAGRFVQMSDVYGSALGVEADVRGSGFLSGQRFFDLSGKEITRAEHPAQVARMSGIPQRNRILGVRAPNGRELWFQASYVPIQQEPGGWSVLTIGVPLERSAFQAPQTSSAGDTEPLLAFAEAVAGRRLPPARVAAHLADVVDAMLPDQASCALLWRRGSVLQIERVRSNVSGQPRPVRLAGEAARRWQMPGTCYIPHMRDTEPIGDRVAVEFDPPVRTFALVPAPDAAGNRVASIGIMHPDTDALSSEQICTLERLGRLAGAALDVAALDAA